ncbi:MAG: 16S rRNA (adenine(1518)-N(6)/adenine(1519)-N(6))-dimethyltransferase RsmA [Flavobacteriales bacterium]|nr:16S rRNA (adenine(1518)-N(6)/adenine(1519)-N(6))-dimethyltransferase RsmA [Flavobacteriales bacterium]
MVKPKKHLGQHFLKNDAICARIAGAVSGFGGYHKMVEVGPGTGALTKHLLQKEGLELDVVEVDTESVEFLDEHYPALKGHIMEEDFLRIDWSERTIEPFAVVGNFPYNISSQILFRVYDFRDLIPEVVGMFQREVAQRVAAPPGSKTYGIISVLLQAYYDIEYLFTVDEHEFIPPPKVKSGVIRLQRNEVEHLDCDEVLFKRVVKQAFNQRRKTLRNSLKPLLTDHTKTTLEALLGLRPEQLSVEQFVEITQQLGSNPVSPA